MTRYFEVTKRDGAARLGRLRLDETYNTPLILGSGKDSPIIYAGSLWERHIPTPDELGSGKLVILPDKSLPLHARSQQIEQIAAWGSRVRQQWQDREGAVGRVIHPARPEIFPADLYVIAAAKQLEHNPRALLDTVLYIRNNAPPDTALYAPSLATPENLAMLIYLGIDVVDDILPTIRAFEGFYMMPGRDHRLSHLTTLPCSCSVCQQTDPEALNAMDPRTRGQLIARHNLNRLHEELRVVIQHIRDGQLREYVEGKCRSSPWLTALLRLMDQEHSYLEQHTPAFRSAVMFTNSSESLERVEITRFAHRINTRYQAPDADILLLLPCSARKPYSISNSHQLFARALGRYRRAVNQVIITSPHGIVPRELELVYPAAHYDTPVTGHWDLEELARVGSCLVDYLKQHEYEHIIAHVEGAYKQICQSAARTLGLDIHYTARDGVTSGESLKTLGSTVKNIVEGTYPLRSPDEIKIDMLRAIADYQFGKGASSLLVPDGALIRAPFPKHQVYYEKQQLASLNPATGALIPTLEGARRLLELGTYQVHIDDFVPGGTLLAPGVVDAAEHIRPGDQVIVVGKKAMGVGRALMGGSEMVRSTRGVAVDLRKVEEL